MTMRLLKYDFRCMLKQFAVVWPAALGIAFLNSFFGPRGSSAVFQDDAIGTILMMIFVGIMIAMAVISAVFVITRFNSGLLRDEGYLMFTLPVRPRQLIFSKLITAMMVIFISGVVGLLSMLLITLGTMNWNILSFELGEIFSVFIRHFTENPLWILVVIEGVTAALLSTMSGILLIYFAISVGHLFSRHRIAAAIVAYIVISSVGSRIIGFIVAALAGTELLEWFMDTVFLYGSSLKATVSVLSVIVLTNILYCTAYFVGTNYILSRKLNLE